MNHFKHKEKTLKSHSILDKLKTRLKNLLDYPTRKDEVIYFVLPGKVVVNETLHDTYGIGAFLDGMVVDYVSDISFVFENVKLLVDLCNKEELPLIYLRDVTKNFINAQHLFF